MAGKKNVKPSESSQSMQNAKPMQDYEDKPDSLKKKVPVAKDETNC